MTAERLRTAHHHRRAQARMQRARSTAAASMAAVERIVDEMAALGFQAGTREVDSQRRLRGRRLRGALGDLYLQIERLKVSAALVDANIAGLMAASSSEFTTLGALETYVRASWATQEAALQMREVATASIQSWMRLRALL